MTLQEDSDSQALRIWSLCARLDHLNQPEKTSGQGTPFAEIHDPPTQRDLGLMKEERLLGEARCRTAHLGGEPFAQGFAASQGEGLPTDRWPTLDAILRKCD